MRAAATAEVRDEGHAPGISVCVSSPAATATDHTACGTRCSAQCKAKSVMSCNCYFDGSFVIVQRDGGLCQPWQVPI